MSETIEYHIDNIEAFLNKEVGLSEWMTIDQDRIDRFAEATDDPNPLHVDPAWARENSPYGGTIAHGFLTISLLTKFAIEGGLIPAGVAYALNYGFLRTRLMAPVKSGARIRNRMTLIGVDRKIGGTILKTRNTVEIENEPTPALVAVWLGLCIADEEIARARGEGPAMAGS